VTIHQPDKWRRPTADELALLRDYARRQAHWPEHTPYAGGGYYANSQGVYNSRGIWMYLIPCEKPDWFGLTWAELARDVTPELF
jgi:hypothetical protein